MARAGGGQTIGELGPQEIAGALEDELDHLAGSGVDGADVDHRVAEKGEHVQRQGAPAHSTHGLRRRPLQGLGDDVGGTRDQLRQINDNPFFGQMHAEQANRSLDLLILVSRDLAAAQEIEHVQEAGQGRARLMEEGEENPQVAQYYDFTLAVMAETRHVQGLTIAAQGLFGLQADLIELTQAAQGEGQEGTVFFTAQDV